MNNNKILSLIITVLIVTLLLSGCVEEDTQKISFEHPDGVQSDERFDISVNGLPKGETVYLNMSSEDRQGENWSYVKSFKSDDGSLALSENKTMSMIQKMEPVKEDYKEPYLPGTEDSSNKWNLTVSIEQANETLATTNITRTFGDPEVSTYEVEDEDIIGRIFEPPGDGPASGVVVLHGSEGFMDVDRAYMLASNGFVALAIQYFGYDANGEPIEQIPNILKEVPIEYVQKAGHLLLDHERVKGEKVGIIGTSKGGELALLSAGHFDIFGPTVAMSGSGVVWESPSRYPSSSWSYQDEPVPYITHRLNYSYSLEVASTETIKNATIPVDNISGPVLAVSGDDDTVWNSVETIGIAIDRLQENDFAYEYEHMIFEEAGHFILYPYFPTAYREKWDVDSTGGTIEGYMEADAEHWPSVLEVLGKVDS